MKEWLNANPGLAQLFSPIIVAIITLFGVLWMHWKTSTVKALEATIGQLKATNNHINLLIADLRDSEAKTNAAYEKTKNQCNELQERAAIDGDMHAREIKRLQDKISELERLMIEQPALIAWGNDMYREAFPVDPDNPVCYCATCWDEKRWIVPIEYDNGARLTCKYWREDWHRHPLPRT